MFVYNRRIMLKITCQLPCGTRKKKPADLERMFTCIVFSSPCISKFGSLTSIICQQVQLLMMAMMR